MLDLDRLIELAPSTLDRFRLDGKVALVIGGTKGLGQAMALALAAAGADVCVVGRGPAGLEETAEAIRGLGRRRSYLTPQAWHVTLIARRAAKYVARSGAERNSWRGWSEKGAQR